MAPNECLCKVTAGNKDYYLLTKETSKNGEFEQFEMMLSDGENAWSGHVTDDDLEKFGKKVHMAYEDMVQQTRKALTKDNVGNITFLYELKKSFDAVQLMWKKHIVTEGIKIQLGSAQLNEQPDSARVSRKIFEHAISSVGVLQEEIKSLQSDKERLVSERATALKRLEKYVTAKEDIEQDMFSKFVMVLNDKKAKLRNLRDENEALQAGGSASATSYSGDPGPSSRSKGRGDAASEDDSGASGDEADDGQVKVKTEYDSEYNTDEDEQPSRPPAKKQRKMKEEPADASLMLDAGDEDDEAPVTGRRRRQRTGSGKKQTPSKPTIPKVPSSDQKTKPGTSRQRSGRSSMRKSSSLHSKSSDNIDADDLIDDF